MSSSHQTEQGHHPSFKQYVLVAMILFVITIVEFFAIWPDPDRIGAAKLPVLIILSAIKFAIVIMFYMHLKFDHRMFTMFFMAGLILAFGVAIALLGLFAALGGGPRAFASANAVPFVHGEHGAETAKPTAVPLPTVPPAVTTPSETTPQVEATTAPEPVAEPSGGSSGSASMEIGTNGDALEFDLSEMSADSGAQVTVTFANGSSALQHNWVLVQAGTKDEVAAAGTAAGPGAGWIPPGDDRVIAATELLDAGATGDVTFTAPAAGTYQFVCTFPGHSFLMFGDFTVK